MGSWVTAECSHSVDQKRVCLMLQVLCIGATNLASELDAALLRPGRFEVTYEISAPSPVGRLEILKYHSRNKPLASQEMLLKVAEVTVVSALSAKIVGGGGPALPNTSLHGSTRLTLTGGGGGRLTTVDGVWV